MFPTKLLNNTNKKDGYILFPWSQTQNCSLMEICSSPSEQSQLDGWLRCLSAEKLTLNISEKILGLAHENFCRGTIKLRPAGELLFIFIFILTLEVSLSVGSFLFIHQDVIFVRQQNACKVP